MGGRNEREWRDSVVARPGASREKKGLTCGAHVSVTGEEKRRFGGLRKPKRKVPFSKCAKALRASWAE
jgi:hypothetical protein